jgi:acetyl-CoA acyltransferase
MADAVIIDAVRTPLGKGRPGGALAGVRPVDLLARPLAALVERTGLDPRVIDDVIVGCVGQIGEQSTNIARRATLAAGYPARVPATTVDRQCGSAQQAIHFGAQAVLAGAYDVVVAGRVESMSHVPMWSAVAGADLDGTHLSERYPDGFVPSGHLG